MKRKIIIAILGPTGVGKTSFTLGVARQLNSEIVCLDSTTVYKGFDIGTAKPSLSSQDKLPHHMLDILEPHEDFDVAKYIDIAHQSLSQIISKNKTPLVTGGSFFYFRCLENGIFDVPRSDQEYLTPYLNDDQEVNHEQMYQDLISKYPEMKTTLSPQDHYRIQRAFFITQTKKKDYQSLQKELDSKKDNSYYWLKYSLIAPKSTLQKNIAERTQKMLQSGFIEEVQTLKKQTPHSRGLQFTGYQQVCDYLNGKINKKDLESKINEKTLQLVKKQMTWIRQDPGMRIIDTQDQKRVINEYQRLKPIIEGES